MKACCLFIVVFAVFTSCIKQPSLPMNSAFNVTSVLNDTAWFGTGKALKIKEVKQKIEDVREFNLIVNTDIDYPGMGSGPNPNTNNGCVDPECTKTQGLVIYNIPLKKGHFNIAKLNKRRPRKNEYARLSYIGNAGGLLNQYVYTGLKPGWIRVTKFNKASGIVEGRFAISFSQDMNLDLLTLRNSMPVTKRFTDGLFRIKLTDVILK
jgi:hypothetical protein